jgi:hypothetical protein
MWRSSNHTTKAPELLEKFFELTYSVGKGAIEEEIRDLVALRASQLNRFAFCWETAGQAGEDAR